MLASLAPLSGLLLPKAAAGNIVYDGSGVEGNPNPRRPASLEPGEVWAQKIVEEDANISQTHRFHITLEAMAGKLTSTKATPYDIIFVLDVSWSMRNYENGLRTAADNAIQKILANNTDTVYNPLLSSADSAHDISNGFQKSFSLTGKNLRSGTYTNIQAGLYAAKQLLDRDRRPDAIPVIILMSDGAPNIYTDDIFTDRPSWITYYRSGGTDGSNIAAAYTLLYATWLRKEKYPDLQIYTVGFRVSSSPRAQIVLNPNNNLSTGIGRDIADVIRSIRVYRPDDVYYVNQDGYYTTENINNLGDRFSEIIDTLTNPVIDGSLRFTDFIGPMFDFIYSNNDTEIEFALDGASAVAARNGSVYEYNDEATNLSVTFDPDNRTVEFVIPASALRTLGDEKAPNSLTFPVKVKSGYIADRYYTNFNNYGSYSPEEALSAGEGCVVEFKPAQENTFYQNHNQPPLLPARHRLDSVQGCDPAAAARRAENPENRRGRRPGCGVCLLSYAVGRRGRLRRNLPGWRDFSL